MMTARPIEIIGGGLAGLSLGLALRRAGADVTIFEAGDYPRHRVCGEFIAGLPPRTRARLQLDPFLADAALDHHVAWFNRASLSRIQKLPSPAFGLSRHTLDHRLADAFASAGGILQTHTRRTDTSDAPGRIFATGRRRATPRWLGLKLHALDLPLARDLEVHLGAHAYVGLARIENRRVNLCGLFQRRPFRAHGPALLLAYLEASHLTALANRLACARLDTASFCAVAAVDFDSHVPLTNEVRLGDASAMIAPFTGHGMAMAFQSAELALDPVLAYVRGESPWPDTRRAIHTALRRRFRLRLASARALHPFLLRPPHQRCLALLNRARLLPLRPLYAALH
jgi:Dehydrogenases (flavoproteins)